VARREPNTIPATLRADRHAEGSNDCDYPNNLMTIHETSTIELPR